MKIDTHSLRQAMPALMLAFAVASLVLTSGCTTTQKQTSTPTPMLTPPAVVEEPEPAYDNPGSLFAETEADYLVADNRARRVGDIVLVKVTEYSSATNTADTETDKDSSVSLGVSSMFGRNYLGGGAIGNTPLLGAQTTNEFEGSGTTSRENTVTATVAARVTRLMPGGLLQLEGARETRVNDETQILVVRGLARSSDISADNVISSMHLADATIEYYGQGILAERQKPGWLTRLLDNVWPF